MPEGFYGNAAFIIVFFGTMAKGGQMWTVFLAVWKARGLQVALIGLCTGLVVLGLLLALIIPSLLPLPRSEARFAFGALLVIFGMRWLRKAILRYMGAIEKRDEMIAFQEMTKALKQSLGPASMGIDWLGVLSAFKSAISNGFQIIFMVIALGSAGQAFNRAGLGAVVASVLILCLGLFHRRPLTETPANRLEFAVGVLLSAFGTFWTAEGLGFPWPGSQLAILVLCMTFWVVGWIAVLRGDTVQKYTTIIPFKTPIP